ncbi:MAG: hypothetical protein ACNS60_09000 [Candidatus Cyclobacteriaceae bacterium M2_1C_046]
MSKRKNPLQNLDDFLKQEASSFVTPKKLSEPEQEKRPVLPPSASEEPKTKTATISKAYIAELIRQLADKNNLSVRNQMLELMQYMLENHAAGNAEDKMLINTILILKYPENWREKIEEYWEKAPL